VSNGYLIVEVLDYQIPVTHLKGPSGDGDMATPTLNFKAHKPPTNLKKS